MSLPTEADIRAAFPGWEICYSTWRAMSAQDMSSPDGPWLTFGVSRYLLLSRKDDTGEDRLEVHWPGKDLGRSTPKSWMRYIGRCAAECLAPGICGAPGSYDDCVTYTRIDNQAEPTAAAPHRMECDFCSQSPVRLIRPVSEAVHAAYGFRLSCSRHLHWVRRLIHLDCGNVRLEEKALGREQPKTLGETE